MALVLLISRASGSMSAPLATLPSRQASMSAVPLPDIGSSTVSPAWLKWRIAQSASGGGHRAAKACRPWVA